jgi:hypothetical protein
MTGEDGRQRHWVSEDGVDVDVNHDEERRMMMTVSNGDGGGVGRARMGRRTT